MGVTHPFRDLLHCRRIRLLSIGGFREFRVAFRTSSEGEGNFGDIMGDESVAMSDLKKELSDYCNLIGIDLFGVTTPDPFDRYLEELKLRESYYAPRYAYRLETWRQMAQPRQVLPDAKSVIVLGYNYYTKDPVPAEACGRVARIVTYGHLGIIQRMRDVVRFLKKRGYAAVPGVHRKEAAVRAGLGMVGKHNLVINPTYGSWVAYQSIVTDAALEPDEPFTEDLCGECTKCIDACPTKALYEPRRLDPTKCIPYLLTDKTTGKEFWPLMDNWILGCDICLESCPANAHCVEKQGQDSFFPGDIGSYPLLEALLTISESEFQNEIMAYVHKKLAPGKAIGMIMAIPGGAQFLAWVVSRFLKGKEKVPDTLVHASSSLDIYRRNAMIAAANRGHQELRPLIVKWKDDDTLGAVANWALDKLSCSAVGEETK